MKRLDTMTMLLVLMTTSGCLKRSEPVVLHTLRPLVAEAQEPAPGLPLAIEVMPVQLPDLLQRPQIVSVQSPERLTLSEVHHWGNPLEKEIQRVLVENLGSLLGDEAIVAYPLGEQVKATLRLTLEIQNLAGQGDGNLQFQALWILTRQSDGATVLFRKVKLKEPVPGSDTDALVAAHSRILAALSREIAGELKKQTAPQASSSSHP